MKAPAAASTHSTAGRYRVQSVISVILLLALCAAPSTLPQARGQWQSVNQLKMSLCSAAKVTKA